MRMLTLVDAVAIGAPPGEVEEWLRHVDEHYREWHPDHIRWINLDGDLEEGKTFYYEEYLNGRIYRSRCLITGIDRDHATRIEFAGLSAIDRALGVCGSFEIAPAGSGSLVTATIRLRFRWLLEHAAGGILRSLRKHMEEEGERLKCMLETPGKS